MTRTKNHYTEVIEKVDSPYMNMGLSPIKEAELVALDIAIKQIPKLDVEEGKDGIIVDFSGVADITVEYLYVQTESFSGWTYSIIFN